MKNFFEKYSYESVRLFLNQVAISLFGLTLALAAGMAGNSSLKLITSVAAIIFYLFLQYTVAWEVGAKDKISIDCGKAKRDLSVPVKMWLLANSLNLLIAVMITLGNLLSNIGFFSTLGGIGSVLAFVIEGEYLGVLSIRVAPDTPLNSLYFMYYVITLPSLVTVFFSYFLGVTGRGANKIFAKELPESDRPEKKKSWLDKIDRGNQK